jgi:hypothetical protein
MQITVIQQDGQAQSTLALCDGATRDQDKSAGPRDMTYSGSQIEQVSPVLRARSALVFDRGNGTDRFTFSVTHYCASSEAALAWLLEHRLAIPRDPTGVKTITVEFAAAGAVIVLQNPVISITEARCMGVSVIVKYNIVGGPLVSAAPGATT